MFAENGLVAYKNGELLSVQVNTILSTGLAEHLSSHPFGKGVTIKRDADDIILCLLAVSQSRHIWERNYCRISSTSV